MVSVNFVSLVFQIGNRKEKCCPAACPALSRSGDHPDSVKRLNGDWLNSIFLLLDLIDFFSPQLASVFILFSFKMVPKIHCIGKGFNKKTFFLL